MKSTTTTIWTVYGPPWLPMCPVLVSAEAKITAKQAKLSEYTYGFGGTVIPIERVHMSPEAAVEAWRKQCAAEIEAAREQLQQAEAKDALPIDGWTACCSCGTAEGVTVEPDPYASELHGDETPVPMCPDCRHEALMDI